MTTVKVPTTPGPIVQLCYASPAVDGSQGNPMQHCDRRKGHSGLHTWELQHALITVRDAWLERKTTPREPLREESAADTYEICASELTEAAGLPDAKEQP